MSLSHIRPPFLQKFSLNFAANWVGVFWMLLGQRHAFLWVKPTFWQFLTFGILALLTNVLFGHLSAPSDAVFSQIGLITYLAFPAVILVAGIVMARRASNWALIYTPVILWLGADIALVLVQSLVQVLVLWDVLPQAFDSALPLIFTLLFVWQTTALLWIFGKQLKWRVSERILVALGATVFLVLWQQNVAQAPIFRSVDRAPFLDEADFYAQSGLLSQKIEALLPGIPNQTDWYVLTVAGAAYQEVFANEAAHAKELFDVRFGSSGRSLMLANSASHWQEAPIASKTALAYALKGIAQKMNPEDVLFLMITSHGAERVLLLENAPLALDNLDAVFLKEALDNAGIQNRIIVISACRSGSFIPTLMTPSTLIITASAADRDSFGCNVDADLTYFGRAFFAEGLRRANTLEGAFVYAKARIKEREALAGVTPSQPQWQIGEVMASRLSGFEGALFSDNFIQE